MRGLKRFIATCDKMPKRGHFFVEFFGVEEARCLSYRAGGLGQGKYVPILSLHLDLFVKYDIIT